MTKTSFCLKHSKRPVRLYAPFDFLLWPVPCPPLTVHLEAFTKTIFAGWVRQQQPMATSVGLRTLIKRPIYRSSCRKGKAAAFGFDTALSAYLSHCLSLPICPSASILFWRVWLTLWEAVTRRRVRLSKDDTLRQNRIMVSLQEGDSIPRKVGGNLFFFKKHTGKNNRKEQEEMLQLVHFFHS